MKKALLLLLVLAGCGGSEKKEETKPAAKGPFLELKMQSPALRTISVTYEGDIADVLSGTSAAKASGKLKPDDLKALRTLAESIDWAKLPAEGWKTPDGKPVEGGRIYDLTYFGTSPAKTVHSMDGAAEIASFTKLRDTIEVDSNKIGK